MLSVHLCLQLVQLFWKTTQIFIKRDKQLISARVQHSCETFSYRFGKLHPKLILNYTKLYIVWKIGQCLPTF